MRKGSTRASLGGRCVEQKGRAGGVIQAVDRALRILTVLQGARPMRLSKIAKELDLHPSTVHGIISTLLAHGMVQQERDSGPYRLGPATLCLGHVYLDTLELRSRVLAGAEELARATGCAIRAGVLLLSDVVVVAHEPRPDSTRQMPETGLVIPAHACALGKALLAFNQDAGAKALAYDRALYGMTGKTITDHAKLRTQLDSVRADGIAYEVEEAVLGECGVAAPLRETAHHAAGAIGLVVPSTQWPLDPAAINELRATALRVSRELGTPI